MPQAPGLRTAIDAMPADCGRDPAKLAELSRRSGVQVVAATGLHHERFYGPSHWSLRATEDDLADLFVGGHRRWASTSATTPARSSRRTTIRAGIVKIAGSEGGPSDRDLPDLPRRSRRPPPDRRPDPHALRGRDRRPRADPRPDRRRRPGRSTSRSATSTRSSTAATTASCWRPGRSPSTTRRSAGATATNGTIAAPRVGCRGRHRLDR